MAFLYSLLHALSLVLPTYAFHPNLHKQACNLPFAAFYLLPDQLLCIMIVLASIVL